ncbi:MAG: polysaccharide deacetylase family protein [Hyphomonadaceae bacterium]
MTLEINETYSPSRTLPAKLRRRMTQWNAAAPLSASPKRAIVSFTFDDFPKSAADTGASIVESVGGRACYYACTGMAGTTTETGEMFDERDIVALSAAGHEIGAHTDTHLDCAQSGTPEVLASINANITALAAMGLAAAPTQFAYPYGETGLDIKEALAGRFQTARGILPGTNSKGSDTMQLRAYELERDDWTMTRAAKAIEAAAQTPAWIILFTHDVRTAPSAYGTTPNVLRKLARLARDCGAAILTPSEAMAEIERAK